MWFMLYGVSTDTLVIVRTGILQNRIDDEMATANS